MDYQARLEEAQQFAANAVRDADRAFWMNILRCWLNLSGLRR